MDTRCNNEIWWSEKRNVRLFERKNDKNWHNRCAINNVTTNVDNKCWLQFWQCLQLYLSCGTVVRAIWKQYGWLSIKNTTHTLTHSPIWIQEMLAHFKSTFYFLLFCSGPIWKIQGNIRNINPLPVFQAIYTYTILKNGGDISECYSLIVWESTHALKE